MRPPLLPIAAAAVSLVLIQAARAAPDLGGQWTGTLHTLQGKCPDQSRSTLIVDHDHLSFAPADGVLVLHGKRGPDRGRLHAQLSLPGFDHKPVAMVFEGHAEGHAIAGMYGTPTCRASIRLEHPEDHPLQRALGR